MAGDERDVQILSKAFEKEKRYQTKEEEPRTGVWGEDFESQGVEAGYFQTDERAGDIPETVDLFDRTGTG